MKTTVIEAGRYLAVTLCVWGLIVLPMLNPYALAQQQAAKARVAVLEFTGVDISKAEAAAVTDQLRNDLVNLGQFTVLDRSQTEASMQELALQQAGVTSAEQAVQIGKMLNVEFIVTGRVTALTGAYQVSAQMIDVESSEIVRSENILYRGDILGLLSENMATIAARLSQVETPPRRPAPLQPPPLEEEDEGWPWWVWALIGVGVVGALAGGGGGGGDDGGGGGGGGGGGSGCPSCGSVGVVW